MDYSFIHNSTVGLDRIMDTLINRSELASKTSNYPPYNIIQEDDYHYLIELAVAGFSEDDLEVELKEDTLKVSGKKSYKDEVNDEYAKKYTYRGISNRAFERNFVLNSDVHVNNVKLEHGMLRISLERIVPEHKKPRKIEIDTGGKSPIGHNSAKQLLMEDAETTEKV